VTEGLAYSIFTVAFMGGLAVFSVATLVIAVVLLRRNRTAR
jgi:hypothetical protein